MRAPSLALATLFALSAPALAKENLELPAGDANRLRATYEHVGPDVAKIVPFDEVQHLSSTTIFLDRCAGGCTIYPGYNNSMNNTSSIVPGTAQISEFRHGDEAWNAVVSCVRAIYEPYGVHITDQDPGAVPHWEAIIAGYSSEIGREGGVGGVSPFSCGIIDNAINFSFANQYNSVRDICETVAQETAHSFGLDHEYLCEDPMSYLDGCGEKWFQDVNASCGEFQPRNCSCGSPTQNSHQRILSTFGPGNPIPPEVTFVKPVANANVEPGFGIIVEATDDIEVKRVELYINGTLHHELDTPPYAFNSPPELRGITELEIRAFDTADAMTAEKIEINVGQSCTATDECPAGRICHEDFCIKGPDSPGGFGASCRGNEECDSDLCGQAGEVSICTMTCTVGAGECPGGYSCIAAGNVSVCWPDPEGEDEDEGGCSQSGGAAGSLAGLLLFVVIFAFRRREHG